MSEGWKQVWQDIRHVLGGSAVEPEPTEVEEQHPDEDKQAARSQPEAPPELIEGAPCELVEGDSPEPVEGLVEEEVRKRPGRRKQESALAGTSGQVETEEISSAPLRPSPSAPPISGGDVVDISASSEEMAAASAPVTPVDRWREWASTVLVVGLILAGAVFLYRDRLFGPPPPAPDVVATYNGGQITVEDVRQHLAELVPDEAMQTQLQNLQGYRLMVEEMLTDELVRRWAADRNVEQDKDIQHVMQHITEEINLDELHTQMHEGQMGVNEGDIQAYYDANRDQFGELTVTQVRDQIRTTLQSQQEDRFAQNYLEGLKDKATITRSFDLLAVPEPTEQELRDYYEANQEQYLLPARAVVNEIRIPVGEDETAAKEQADKALVRLRSGEALALVANDLSQSPLIEGGLTVMKGQRDPAYDEVVFNLDEGEISQVFRAGDAFYIVRLQSKELERQQDLDEIRAQVRQAVLTQKETAWFEDKAEQTLITINGKRFTVGEFWQEYQELPPTFVIDFQGAAGRQALAERLIERLLLLEDSYDRLLNVDNQGELEEVRLDVLTQMMEQEEVDDRIEIADEELQAFYEQHKSELVEPPQSRIRQIMIRLGQTEDDYQRAWDKANEAYQKLVPGLFEEGADFAGVAREYSEDEATAAQGGEVPGWIGEGPDLFEELTAHGLHQQILSLVEGEISRPFEWNGAVYIVQVLEQKEPRQLSFDEAKEILREELRLQKHEELAVQLSQKLMEQSNVTVYDQALQMLLEEQQAGQP